ncbi:hypothetical protein CEQ21_07985 (plasmid) [Niallia circulans]|uniref:Uncharacterized protein n=1 Tax=Niallia circulans TaxID=1397 RepID=A0A553SQN3_NIACI|nr:hypothetical protein CEQ21_07985 [Niallia circulans]
MIKKMAFKFIKYSIILISFLFIYNYVVGNVVSNAVDDNFGPMLWLIKVAVMLFLIRLLIRIFKKKRG